MPKMSQHIQHHHPQQPQYVHYTPTTQLTVAPQDTTRQPQLQVPQPLQHQQQPPAQPQAQQPSPGTSASAAVNAGSTAQALSLAASGDWTKDLIQLAKTAELKKHALTLQLHTAHILSAYNTLDLRNKAIQDIREQKNKLESERIRLLNALREINEDRDKADMMEATLERECNELKVKITQLTEGDYAIAKKDVDRLRQELGQPPLPSLQDTLEEKTAQYLNERRLNGSDSQTSSTPAKRAATEQLDSQPNSGKRPRGRPKGSKNKAKAMEGA